jgi:hypothetical protein
MSLRFPLRFTAAIATLLATSTLPVRTALAADPTTADCLAASDAANKLAAQHKLRAQRSQLLVCAASSCPGDIRKDCSSRVETLNAEIPTVIFDAKDPSGAELSAVKVTMDGEVLTERLEGTALSVDPGQHVFTFETQGQDPVSKTYVVQQAQKDRRELIAFVGSAPAVPAAPAPAPAPPPAPADRGEGLGTQKVLALVAGGIGIVGLGVGTAFGLVALSKKNDAQSACPASTCANQADASKWSDAGSAGNISTIAFVVGGVAVAGGLVLWFTAPGGGGTASTQVGLGMGSMQLRGSW